MKRVQQRSVKREQINEGTPKAPSHVPSVLRWTRFRKIQESSFFQFLPRQFEVEFPTDAAARLQFAPQGLIDVKLVDEALGGPLFRRKIVVWIQRDLRVLYGTDGSLSTAA